MQMTHWEIDPAHSEIHFKIRHLVIATITGAFRMFKGKLDTNTDDFQGANIALMIDVYSIDTNYTERDEHLKSAAFFDVDRFPEIKFQSTSFTHIQGDHYDLAGNFTMKGVTKPIVLKVEFGGQAKDGFGTSRAGFEINGVVNRRDFDLSYSDVTETGGLVLGDEVKISANIQFVKKE